MIESKEKVIDGTRVLINQLPAMRSLRLLPRLGKVFGPALSKLATADAALMQMDMRDLAAAVATVFETLTEDELAGFTRDLLYGNASLELNGRLLELKGDAEMNAAFTGRVSTLLKTLLFAIEVNYSDFFDALKRQAGALPGAKPSM